MRDINVGIVGLGNVGSGAVTILAENAAEIAARLGFRLNLEAVCSRRALRRPMVAGIAHAFVTENWREVVTRPGIDIVVELVGGTGVARQVVEGAIANGKSVVTANKELIALDGLNIWRRAAERGVSLGLEASVCGGIPIHAVLREGICADRIETLFGILNGTSNYILTEIEKHGTPFNVVLAEAQKLGYAEADPAADIDGFDARSKLALLAAFAFGVRLDPLQIAVEGIRRIVPVDFRYAHQLGCTLRLLGSARREDDGLFVSVRPALVPLSTVLASVQGAYNGVWSRGAYGADTFYYGQGAGSLPTGVAVVSDLMRVARDLQTGNLPRVSPFGYATVTEAAPRDHRRAAARMVPAVPRGRPARHHRRAERDSGRARHQHRRRAATAGRGLALAAVCHHDRGNAGVESARRAGPDVGIRLHGRAASSPGHRARRVRPPSGD